MSSSDDSPDHQDSVEEKNEPSLVVATNVTQAQTSGDLYGASDTSLDLVYKAKAKVLGDAFQEMGMGKYQVCVWAASKVRLWKRLKRDIF